MDHCHYGTSSQIFAPTSLLCSLDSLLIGFVTQGQVSVIVSYCLCSLVLCLFVPQVSEIMCYSSSLIYFTSLSMMPFHSTHIAANFMTYLIFSYNWVVWHILHDVFIHPSVVVS